MAVVNIMVPDAQMPRIGEAFAAQYSYTGVNPQGQPETKQQFVLRKIKQHIADVVKSYEAPLAAETARKAAIAKVDGEIVLG